MRKFRLCACAHVASDSVACVLSRAIHSWDCSFSAADSEVCKLKLPEGETSVLCMCFSADGWLLAAVSANVQSKVHSIHIFDWRSTRLLCSAQAARGEPPQVYGIVWNAFEDWSPEHTDGTESSFVTFGQRGVVMFWELMDANGGASIEEASRSPKIGRFGKWTEQPCDVLSGAYVRTGHFLAGMYSGDICFFCGNTCCGRVKPKPYAKAKRAHDVSVGQWGLRNGGCTALILHPSEKDRVLSAGCDDDAPSGLSTKLIDWRVVSSPAPVDAGGVALNTSSGSIQLLALRCFTAAEDTIWGVDHQMIVGLDWHPHSDRVVIGTTSGMIWELNMSSVEPTTVDADTHTLVSHNEVVMSSPSKEGTQIPIQTGHAAIVTGIASSSAGVTTEVPSAEDGPIEPASEKTSPSDVGSPYFAASCEDGYVCWALWPRPSINLLLCTRVSLPYVIAAVGTCICGGMPVSSFESSQSRGRLPTNRTSWGFLQLLNLFIFPRWQLTTRVDSWPLLST